MALVPYNSRDNGFYTTRSSSFPGYHPRQDRGAVYSSKGPDPSRPRGFPFMGVRLVGAVLLLVCVLLFIIGIVAVALNVPPEENNPGLMIFGAITMSALTLFALAAGVIGVLHSEYRTNLEAYRNSFLVLCVVSAVLSTVMWVTEAVYHDEMYGNNIVMTADMETNSAVWITMTVFTALLSVVATIGAFIVCCMPGLCTPIVDNDAYVYSYDRRQYDYGDQGFLRFLGLGGNRRSYYDDEPTRVFNSRERIPRDIPREIPTREVTRERYIDDYPRYATRPTGRYY